MIVVELFLCLGYCEQQSEHENTPPFRILISDPLDINSEMEFLDHIVILILHLIFE